MYLLDATGFYSLGLQALGVRVVELQGKNCDVLFGLGDLKRRVTGFKPTPIFVVIQELKQFPFSQDTWEHVRINGKVEVIDASNSDQTKLQEKASFANSLKSRLMYICPAPGTPYNNEQPNQEGH
ncbi:pyridoxine/pyridoxamine 5'-phosphate oxidase 2-like isoform X2 [Raphanus sativus]|uniref:Pyridoxine/pyridoxamine 5'-phosphate oxidase 2-like isoform X2 n=1 Tax=Raphanus sativus TaxID=3726 RepID=A0A6J0KYH7_RAPSA|nr:pyridoxine/pyridoxamine 5'-phosphate oxidase 2-like isoform X2 [Raphanus sativus]XP_018452952.1 pyridoxine/pyridoxamine 5'-phosphate oxidase 2-like isoform X2 [Raphanus sativus]